MFGLFKKKETKVEEDIGEQTYNVERLKLHFVFENAEDNFDGMIVGRVGRWDDHPYIADRAKDVFRRWMKDARKTGIISKFDGNYYNISKLIKVETTTEDYYVDKNNQHVDIKKELFGFNPDAPHQIVKN